MGRPEWGVGIVTSAQAINHEGTPCQRLACRFERAGLKTVSTALADIRAAGEADSAPEQPDQQAAQTEESWLDTLDAPAIAQRMAKLPEPTTDPFSSLEARLRATADLYRFSDHGSPLLDWAAAQTGLQDPLNRFNRHELEEFFRRYAHNRDEHLKLAPRRSQEERPPTPSPSVATSALRCPPRPRCDGLHDLALTPEQHALRDASAPNQPHRR